MEDFTSNQSLISPNELKIEKRAYDEDSTPEEMVLLEKRISICEKNIILYDEIPVVCPFSINFFFQKAENLARDLNKEFDRCGLIIDVSGVTHPDARTRKVINQCFTRVCNTFSHVAFVTGKDVFINTTIRFVLFGTNLKSYSVNKSVEEAINNTKKSLK